jgi:predicted phage tail protein
LEKLTLIKIHNPFNRVDRDIVPVEYNGESLLVIRDANIPAGLPVSISINGTLIECANVRTLEGENVKESEIDILLSKVYPKAGDHILFMPVIEGGGNGDNKSVLRIVLMIIVMVVAPYVAPMLGLTGMAATIMTCAVMVVGGMLVNALLPPPTAKLPAVGSDYDASQAYGWNPQTLQAQGPAVPKWYGVNRLYGNIIAANIETAVKSYCHALIDLGLGPIQRLYDFKINDQPYENFKGVALETRYGTLDQEVLNTFIDTKNEFPLAVKVVKDTPYIYTTIGDAFHALAVELTFPGGLFYAEDSGHLSPVTVNVRLSIRRQGDTDWRVLTSSVLTTKYTVYDGKWSAGIWVDTGGVGGGEEGPGGGNGGGKSDGGYEGYGGEGKGYH